MAVNKMFVEVAYLAHIVRYDLASFTVAEVMGVLADVLNVRQVVEAYVRGSRANGGYRLMPSDHLVLMPTCGSKGGHEARNCYDGSNGEETKRLLKRLQKCGQLGRLAAQLFRVQKSSSRAKRYRRGSGVRRNDGSKLSYRDLSYDHKGKCLKTLCEMLTADSCDLEWGWKPDPSNPIAPNILYVETPIGQVSFHSPNRYEGPDFLGEWDRLIGSEQRIVQFCQEVLDGGQDGCTQTQ
jgi:hypothetical protein